MPPLRRPSSPSKQIDPLQISASDAHNRPDLFPLTYSGIHRVNLESLIISTDHNTHLSADSNNGAKHSLMAALNWRKEVDDNLKRLRFLISDTDIALDAGNPAAARTLSLRLLGFLDFYFQTPVDAAASRALAADSDREVFEQAQRDVGLIFMKKASKVKS